MINEEPMKFLAPPVSAPKTFEERFEEIAAEMDCSIHDPVAFAEAEQKMKDLLKEDGFFTTE